jgi:hypothetical protein
LAAATAIADLYGDDDGMETGELKPQTAANSEAVERVLADDSSWRNTSPAGDDSNVVLAGGGLDDFASALEALELEYLGKRKKTAI